MALLAAAPALVAGSASAATVDQGAPSATSTAPSAAPAPKTEQKAAVPAATQTTSQAPAATTTQAAPQAAAPAKPGHVQVATTPKAEVTKAQADAVAKELGAKPTDALSVQLGKYHEQIEAAHALKEKAARDKAVTEARQQLTAIGGKPVTPEQAAKVDGILGVKAPSTIQ
ncbi:phosphoribosylformylglycinamidine (FGAM) synthase PurS component [Azospirillum agricola]|uniref:hypothetical protein n=1 Tax=Azospirillum agricola TaxID=1720247 RepID=UPI002D7F1E8D|nr:hypothetical protein [Azospirillum agricola]MBP2227168.1 phosphoribosylformylglycinamidine (FGAM) synthase PurS component [Azospirillum agricola]